MLNKVRPPNSQAAQRSFGGLMGRGRDALHIRTEHTICARRRACKRYRTQKGNSEPSQASPHAPMFGVPGPRGTFGARFRLHLRIARPPRPAHTPPGNDQACPTEGCGWGPRSTPGNTLQGRTCWRVNGFECFVSVWLMPPPESPELLIY